MPVAFSLLSEESRFSSGLRDFYETLTTAVEARRIEPLEELLSEEFRSIPPNGEPFDKAGWIENIGRELEKYEFRDVHYTIEKVVENSEHVSVYVTRRLVSMDAEGSATERRHYITYAKNLETFDFSNDLPRLIRSESLERMLTIDGKVPSIREQRQIQALCQMCDNPDN